MKIQYGPKQKFTKSPILIIEESLFFFPFYRHEILQLHDKIII